MVYYWDKDEASRVRTLETINRLKSHLPCVVLDNILQQIIKEDDTRVQERPMDDMSLRTIDDEKVPSKTVLLSNTFLNAFSRNKTKRPEPTPYAMRHDNDKDDDDDGNSSFSEELEVEVKIQAGTEERGVENKNTFDLSGMEAASDCSIDSSFESSYPDIGSAAGSGTPNVSKRHHRSALLFVDISGFTKLSTSMEVEPFSKVRKYMMTVCNRTNP